MNNFAPVMVRDQILQRQTVVREQTLEFHNYVQVMFRPIIRTYKKYVKRQYTIFVTQCEIFPCLLRHSQMCYGRTSVHWRKSCFQLIFSTVKRQGFRNYTNFITCLTHVFRLTFIKSGFRQNAIKRISSLVVSNASQSYSAHIR